MAKNYICFLFLFVIIFGLMGCGSGGGGSATISGYVQDSSNYYLSGVKISLGGVANTVTSWQGGFETTSFPLGTYTISFSLDGYWTLSFPVTFSQSGDYEFTDAIHLSKIISGQGTVEEPVFIKDLTNNSELTIKADNKVKSLIALSYIDNSAQVMFQTNVAITTDLSTSSLAINNNISSNKSPLYNRTKTDPYQGLRDFDRKVNQRMFNKGILPGLSQRSSDITKKGVEDPQKSFYKYNFDINDTFSSINANLKYNGSLCLIYVDNQQNISDNDIQQIGQAFDNTIYNRVIQYFGDLTVNIDNYNKVYVLLTELPHYSNGNIIAGYFSSINEFSQSLEPYSNVKEMIYLTTYTYDSNKPTAWLNMTKANSAHELQHLINYSCRVNNGESPVWINEGLSMVAEDIAIAGPSGHNPYLDSYISLYMKYHAIDCLLDWQGDILDYASAYMFMRYFADRCGENNLRNINIASYYDTDGNPMTSIAGSSHFDKLLADWLTAVILDSLGYTCGDPALNSLYTYQTLNLSNFEFPKQPPGYIFLAEGAGEYVYLPNLESAGRIDVAFSGSSYIKSRLIMLPVSQGSFSAAMLHPLRLIKRK